MADVRYTIEVDGVTQSITTLSSLDATIKKLRTTLQNATLGSAAFTKAQRELAAASKLQQSVLMSSGGAMGKMGNQTAQAGVAVQNMNFVIRDSPFFFKDLQLGVLAVGNNINPLIDSFQRLKIQAAQMTAQTGKTVTSFSLLRKTLSGPMGLSIAMSLVVTAFQAVVFTLGKADKKARELKTTLQGVADAMIKMINPFEGVSFEASLDKMTNSIKQMKAELVGITGDPLTGLGAPIAQKVAFNELGLLLGIGSKNLTEDQKKRVALLKTTLATMEKQKATLEAQQQVSKLLTDFGFTQVDNEKKKKDALKGQNSEYLSQIELIQRLVSGIQRYEAYRGGGEAGDGLGGGMRLRVAPRKPLLDAIKASADQMKLLGQVASQTGTLLAQAFMQGTFAIDRFLQSLLATVAQMLILRALTRIFSPVAAISPIPIPVGGGVLNKGRSGNIQIQGKITADKNKFIANIENAKEQFYNNEGFVVIGR